MEILEIVNTLIGEWDSTWNSLAQKPDSLRLSSEELSDITTLIKSINSSCKLIKLKPSSSYLYHINSNLIEQQVNEVKKNFLSLRNLSAGQSKQKLLDECYHNFNCILLYLSNLRNASPKVVEEALGNMGQDVANCLLKIAEAEESIGHQQEEFKKGKNYYRR